MSFDIWVAIGLALLTAFVLGYSLGELNGRVRMARNGWQPRSYARSKVLTIVRR